MDQQANPFAKYLQEQYANPINFALYQSVVLGISNDIIKYYISMGADINTKYIDGESLLMVAVRNSRSNAAELLISLTSEINHQNKYGQTALMLASGAPRTTPVVCELLVANGADVNFRDNYNQIAIDSAWAYGRTEIFDILIREGSEINNKNKGGFSLMSTRAYEHESVQRMATLKGQYELHMNMIKRILKYLGLENVYYVLIRVVDKELSEDTIREIVYT